jgi:hypothetical protein
MARQKARKGETVDGYLARLEGNAGDCAREAAKVIRAQLKGATESIKWGWPFWTGRKHICAIMALSDYVNIEFFRGMELPDPDGLLEGTGKLLRHVKIRKPADARRKVLAALLKAAQKLDGT